MASNAPDRFRFSPVGQWQTTDAGFWLTVTALDTNDQVVTGFAGTITLQAVGLEGSVTVEPVSFGPFTQGQHTAVVRVTTPGKAVRLNALEVPGESDGFNVGRPMFFEVSQPLMAGITWHEQSQTLFATVSSGAGQYANQLVAIDLGTGEVTNSYPLAPSPGQIEMSPEGQYLYTAVNNGLKLQRFNLTTRQAEVPFNIDSSHPDYTKSVYDFCVLAGTTDSVVIVGWDNFSMSSQNGGVWRFDGSRRTELQNFSATGGRFIQSLPSSAEVLLSPPLVKGQAQSGMPLSTAAQFCNGAAIYSDGRIYDQCGNFYSGATLEKLGSYPGVVSGAFYAGMMEVDPDAGRVFYFDGDQTWRTCYSLKAFDRDLCQLVARFDVAKPPARLIRCGTNGLAYLTGEGQLILVRPDLLQPSQAPVDLRVSLVPLLPQPVLGSNYPVLLTVSNAGPGTASVIRVTNNLPALATVIQTAASTGSVAVSSSGFAWYFTGLPAGSNATLEVTLRFGAAGWQTNRLWAIGFEKDPVITNNVVEWAQEVQLPLQPGGARLVNVASEDLLYDPSRDRLLLSVGAGSGQQTNGIAVVNPHTGSVEQFVSLGHKPGKLARSDDGQFLYVYMPNDRSVRRLDLVTLTTLQEFALGGEWPYWDTWYPYELADMATVPGQPLALAVCRLGHGIAIYDSGVVRSNVMPADGYWAIEVDADGTLYGFDQQAKSFYGCAVGEDGVNVREKYPPLAYSIGNDFKCAAGRLLTSAGRAVRLAPFGVEGVYSGSQSATLVEPDVRAGLVYYLASANAQWQLNVYAMDSFDWLGSVTISNLLGTPSSLVRWGADGLAFRTTSNQLYLVRTGLGHPADSADITLTQSSPLGIVSLATNFVMMFTVTNNGPAVAQAAVLTNWISSTAKILAATSTVGMCAISSNALIWSSPTLEAGAGARITVTVQPIQTGQVTSTATVQSESPDCVPGNNTAVTLVQVEAPPAGDRVMQLQLSVRDLLWWSSAGRILATASPGMGLWSNCLVSLDPSTGQLCYESPVGTGANKMAWSGDKQRLFVGVDYGVQTIEVPAMARSLAFALDPLGNGVTPIDLASPPGSSNLLAVAGIQPWSGFVGLYKNGVLCSNTVARRESRLQFSTPDRIHVLVPGGSLQVSTLGVGPDGLVELTNNSGFASWGAGADFRFDQGRLYTAPGAVLDAGTLAVLGTFPSISTGALVYPENSAGRVFFLLCESNVWALAAFDAQSYQRLGSLPIPGVSGTPSHLIRWGANGFAFCTSGGQVFVVRTSLMPRNLPADLALGLSLDKGPYVAGSNMTVSLVITNRGPNPAAGVLWSNALPTGAMVVSAAVSSGSVQTNSTAVSGLIDSLDVDATVAVTIVFRPATSGFFATTARVWSDAVDLTNANNSATALLWVQPPDPASATNLFALATKDLVRDATGERLFASLGASAGALANSVVAIDPQRSIVSPPLWVGGDPGRLAVSADGQFLYVALDADRAVQRFRLTDLTPDLRFSVPQNRQVLDMAVDPTNPELIALRRGDGRISLHEHGIARPKELSGLDLFAFSDTTGELYACVGSYSGVPLNHVDKGPAGATLLDQLPGKQSQATDLKFARGRLHFSGGMIVQPETRRVVAILPFAYSALVEPDPAGTSVFGFWQASGSTWTLRAFDGGQFVELGATNIPGVTGTPTRLTRWGANGIAFRTPTQLYIGCTGLAPTNPPTDVALDLAVVPAVLGLRSNMTCTLMLTNAGAADAIGVVVTQGFTLAVTNVVLSTTNGTALWTNNLITWRPGDLGAGAAAELTVNVRPTQYGTLGMRAEARHQALDPSLLNNVALAAVPVAAPGGTNLIQLSLATRELVYDPNSGRLFASVPASEGLLGNSVLEIDPATSIIQRRFFGGSGPDQLAASDDGRYLYVGEGGAMGVRRIDLLGGAPDLEFPLTLTNTLLAKDIVVQPGHPETIAVVPILPNNDYPAGVAIYDGASRRSQASAQYQCSRVLAFSPDGQRLYGSIPFGMGYGFLRLAVTQAGVSLIDINQSFHGEDQFQQENGLVYGNSGLVVDPNLPALLWTNAASGLVAPDASAARVFYLAQKGTAWELRAFEMGTWQPAGTQAVPAVSGTPGNLTRCGTNRLAFRTSNNQLFLVQSGLVPSLPVVPADLIVTQAATQEVTASSSGPMIFSITVSNAGPGVAQVVTVTDSLPQPMAGVTAQTSQGNLVSGETNLLWKLGSLAPGAIAQLRLELAITNTMPFTNIVNAVPEVCDPDLASNRSELASLGIWFQQRDHLRRLYLATRDLAFDRAGGRLLATLADTNSAGQIVWLNPATAAIDGSIAVAPGPDRLAISEDGQYLYVSFLNTSLVQRVYLPSNLVDLSFSMVVDTAPQAMTVLPGPEHLLAVTCLLSNQTGATSVFADGVPRGNPVIGNALSLLAAGSDGSTFYGYSTVWSANPLYRYRVDAGGLSLVATGPPGLPWGVNSDMVFQDDRLIFSSGDVINTVTWADEGGFFAYYFSSVRVNKTAQRAIFLHYDGIQTATLKLFDLSSRQLLAQIDTAGVAGGAGNLRLCDSDRLAFRSPNEVFLVRSSLIATDPSADLTLRGKVSDLTPTLGNAFQYSLTVSNAGPNPASNVFTRLPLTSQFYLGPVTTSHGSIQTNASYVECDLGLLNPGQGALISITVTGAVVGALSNQAVAFSSAMDPTISNNIAILTNVVVLPRLTVSDVQVVEGNRGFTNAIFTISHNSSLSPLITVDYATRNGTAVSNQDYIPMIGTLSFPLGVNRLTVAVPVHGDLTPESDELFYLALANPMSATLARTQGAGTILNDDGRLGKVSAFAWSQFTAIQGSNQPFAAVITACDVQSNLVPGFNGAVNLTALADNAALINGDFDQGSLSPWQSLNLGTDPGPYQVVPFDTTGQGQLSYAFRLTPNNGNPDGIKQRLLLRGGVAYSFDLDAAQTYEGYTANSGTQVHITVGDTEVCAFNFGYFGDNYGGVVFRTNLHGVFLAPTNGTYDIKILIDRPYAVDGGLWGIVDNLRVAPVSLPSPAPNIVIFTNGVWSGWLRLTGLASNIFLRADDGNGHIGDSPLFTVLPVPSVRLLGLVQGAFQMEFPTLKSQRYSIQYSSDLVTWKTVSTEIVGTGDYLPWTDAGPPQTESSPAVKTGSRFYRVVLLP